jgi:hypothetical protein
VLLFNRPHNIRLDWSMETLTMFKLIRQLLQDKRGTAMAGDWVFVATILVLGAVTGMVTMRQTRLPELAGAFKAQAVAKTPNTGK